MRNTILKPGFILLLVCVVLLTTSTVFAQESGPAASDERPPEGLGALVLLFGVGAIFAVGGIFWLRERFPNFPSDTK